MINRKSSKINNKIKKKLFLCCHQLRYEVKCLYYERHAAHDSDTRRDLSQI